VPIVLKSGGLNLLEPSEPVQACNGIALPLPLPLPLPFTVECKMLSVENEQVEMMWRQIRIKYCLIAKTRYWTSADRNSLVLAGSLLATVKWN